MPTFYNFKKDGHTYSFEDFFVPADVFRSGNMWTWGYNQYGQLGTNDYTHRSTPTTIFNQSSTWKQVAVSYYYTAAIKTDGTLWTWGYGGSANLGTNDNTTRITPVTTFAGGTDWKQVDIGFYNSVAIKTDGTLWTWGYNQNGQLGTGDYSTRVTPVTTFAGGTNWKQVAANGYRYTTAIKTDGTLWVWGNASYSMGIGEGPAPDRKTPVTTFAGGTNWADTANGYAEELYTISTSTVHSGAIKTDGTLWTWGRNNEYELGTNNTTTTSSPVTTFAGGTNWRQLDFSYYNSFAIKTDGTLWVWGRDNSNYNISGTNQFTNIVTPVTTFLGGTNWKQVSSHIYISAAVKTDGTLWTWGNNYYGQRGDDTLSRSTDNIVTPVTTFAGGTNWADTANGYAEELYTFSAGLYFESAIKTDGTLWTWGYNNWGQLGTNDLTTRFTPVTTFAGGTNWKQVSCGREFAAAIKTDGTLWTWGRGSSYYSLGNNDYGNRSTPVTTFAGGTDWKQVACGQYHVAAVKTDGTLWTWGYNPYGELGTNDQTNRLTPITTFAGGTNWKQVSGGEFATSAIKTDGTLWTWGYNNVGQLGTNDNSNRSTPVTTFAGGNDWKQVKAGTYHTAAIKTDGTLWTWGYNPYGELGTNDQTPNRSTPVTTFAGGTDWKQVSLSNSNASYAVKTDGTLWVWGRNNSGALGTNDQSTRLTPVTTFAGGTNWTQVSVGTYYNAMALKVTGGNQELYVWGYDGYSFGGLGVNNIGVQTTKQRQLGSSTNWKQVSVNQYSVAAVKTDGTLWTWGYNGYANLGTNDYTNKSTPVTTFAGGNDWKQVKAGTYHTAAIKTDGTLWTWGYNNVGELGTNDQTNRPTPVTTFAGGTNWKQAAVGNYHTAAVKTDGTLWTWGSSVYGELGTNDKTSRSTPVTTFAGGTNWKQVDCGSSSTIALKVTGVDQELYIWGRDDNNQLGINKNLVYSTPVTTFAGGNDWKEVFTTKDYGDKTAAIKTDGTLWVWGNNYYGSLGINEFNTSLIAWTPATTFAGGNDWKQVSLSRRHANAIKTDGTLWGWGYPNYGLPTPTNYIPVTVLAGANDWKTISSGGYQTLAIKTDGSLWVWGTGNSSSYNNLGTGSVTNIYTPVTVYTGLTNWKQAVISYYHSAAITYDDYSPT